MADTGEIIDLTSSVELTSSLLEQLGKTYIELKAHRIAAINNVPWNEIERYFLNLESNAKKKLEELVVKEKEYTERESHNNMLILERETTVMTKEHDMLDRVQELKDAAVAAIAEARASYVSDILETASGGDTNEKKVSSSFDTELDGQEGNSPRTMGKNIEDVDVEVNPRPELLQFCEQMDSVGLLKFVLENLNNPSAVCKEVSVALDKATEPAILVLNALEGFFPPSRTSEQEQKSNVATDGMRRSCLVIMEALSVFLSKADSALDSFITPDTKHQAKSIACEWKPKLGGESIDATNANSLEAEGFLWLLATFRIASEFDEDELCKYVLAVSHYRQATELCRSLELTQKIPGLVETLIKSGRQIDAVHFIHVFQLSEAFPTVPLLKTYLKELRRNSQGNGSAALQNDYNARELEALRAVIDCVEKYKLEDEYPLDALYRRVAQLDKSVKIDRKRTSETVKSKQPHPKKPRYDSGSKSHRPRGHVSGRQVQQPFTARATYTARPERYTPVPLPSAYSYPVPSQYPYAAQTSDQYPYAAQTSDQSLYYYPQDNRAGKPYSGTAPTYGTYSQPPRQQYM